VNGKSLVDPELVVEIERITGVSRHELRPDLRRIFGGACVRRSRCRLS
jgi:DNA-binding transcriptional regulator YdaS (Cro superfamily)